MGEFISYDGYFIGLFIFMIYLENKEGNEVIL